MIEDLDQTTSVVDYYSNIVISLMKTFYEFINIGPYTGLKSIPITTLILDKMNMCSNRVLLTRLLVTQCGHKAPVYEETAADDYFNWI